jgi:hypothetical protein
VGLEYLEGLVSQLVLLARSLSPTSPGRLH